MKNSQTKRGASFFKAAAVMGTSTGLLLSSATGAFALGDYNTLYIENADNVESVTVNAYASFADDNDRNENADTDVKAEGGVNEQEADTIDNSNTPVDAADKASVKVHYKNSQISWSPSNQQTGDPNTDYDQEGTGAGKRRHALEIGANLQVSNFVKDEVTATEGTPEGTDPNAPKPVTGTATVTYIYHVDARGAKKEADAAGTLALIPYADNHSDEAFTSATGHVLPDPKGDPQNCRDTNMKDKDLIAHDCFPADDERKITGKVKWVRTVLADGRTQTVVKSGNNTGWSLFTFEDQRDEVRFPFATPDGAGVEGTSSVATLIGKGILRIPDLVLWGKPKVSNPEDTNTEDTNTEDTGADNNGAGGIFVPPLPTLPAAPVANVTTPATTPVTPAAITPPVAGVVATPETPAAITPPVAGVVATPQAPTAKAPAQSGVKAPALAQTGAETTVAGGLAAGLLSLGALTAAFAATIRRRSHNA